MLAQRWAITSKLSSNELSGSELAQVAAACQLQLQRDLPRCWPDAHVVSVQAFPDPNAVPVGYSVATAMGLDEMPSGALGFHFTKHRLPAANIGFDPNDPAGVATTFSHELLEAAIDPGGNRKVIASVPGVGRVYVLVEVADPPEAVSYEVDGLPMSDFVVRDFFGPHRWSTRTSAAAGEGAEMASGSPVTRAFSFTGHIDTPLTVLKGGYLSFMDPHNGEWGQVTWFDGPAPSIRTLGRRDEDDPRPDREWIDARTQELALPVLGRHGT